MFYKYWCKNSLYKYSQIHDVPWIHSIVSPHDVFIKGPGEYEVKDIFVNPFQGHGTNKVPHVVIMVFYSIKFHI